MSNKGTLEHYSIPTIALFIGTLTIRIYKKFFHRNVLVIFWIIGLPQCMRARNTTTKQQRNIEYFMCKTYQKDILIIFYMENTILHMQFNFIKYPKILMLFYRLQQEIQDIYHTFHHSQKIAF